MSVSWEFSLAAQEALRLSICFILWDSETSQADFRLHRVYQARFGFINNQSTDQIPRELTDTLLRPLELHEMRLS